jgi:hypothetical protein
MHFQKLSSRKLNDTWKMHSQKVAKIARCNLQRRMPHHCLTSNGSYCLIHIYKSSVLFCSKTLKWIHFSSRNQLKTYVHGHASDHVLRRDVDCTRDRKKLCCPVCIKLQVFPLISLVSLVLLFSVFVTPTLYPWWGKYFVKSRQKVGPHILAKLAEKWSS